jgi:hypothetical protein
LLSGEIGMTGSCGWVVLATCLSIPSPLPKDAVLRSHHVVVVRHEHERSGTWHVSSTANFQVHHDGSWKLAERVGIAAERARDSVANRWFGEEDADWAVPCRIFLHADGTGFARATGQAGSVPGYSFTETDGDRVVSRRIDLRSDHQRLLSSVLPHEVTHILLAYRFGAVLPPWANEGMAILSEPEERVRRHLQDLPRYRRDGLLWRTRQLIEMSDYPTAQFYGPFYAQSVSLVEFLVQEKGQRDFTRFLRASQQEGWEQALATHYGWSFRELEQKWQRYAFPADAK